MATSYTEGTHSHEGLISESPMFRSREEVTVLSGQNLSDMHVVGKVSHAWGRAPVPTVSGTGNGTMSNVKPGPLAKAGTYTVTCTTAATNGGTFSVTDPDSVTIGTLVLTAGAGTATVFRSDQMEFTITDGSTDFVVNDSFSIVVAEDTAPTVVGTGNGTLSAISLGRHAEHGTYTLTCTAAVTNGGTFSITTPSGARLPDLVMTAGAGTATAYTSDHVNLTITDGATDFAADDVFYLAVLQGSGKYVAWDPTPTDYDGRHRVGGVLLTAVDASSADKSGAIIARDAEVLKGPLSWLTGLAAGEQNAAYEQMKDLNIIARDNYTTAA